MSPIKVSDKIKEYEIVLMLLSDCTKLQNQFLAGWQIWDQIRKKLGDLVRNLWLSTICQGDSI